MERITICVSYPFSRIKNITYGLWVSGSGFDLRGSRFRSEGVECPCYGCLTLISVGNYTCRDRSNIFRNIPIDHVHCGSHGTGTGRLENGRSNPRLDSTLDHSHKAID